MSLKIINVFALIKMFLGIVLYILLIIIAGLHVAKTLTF